MRFGIDEKEFVFNKAIALSQTVMQLEFDRDEASVTVKVGRSYSPLLILPSLLLIKRRSARELRESFLGPSSHNIQPDVTTIYANAQ